jgi:hypothetical protein
VTSTLPPRLSRFSFVGLVVLGACSFPDRAGPEPTTATLFADQPLMIGVPSSLHTGGYLGGSYPVDLRCLAASCLAVRREGSSLDEGGLQLVPLRSEVVADYDLEASDYVTSHFVLVGGTLKALAVAPTLELSVVFGTNTAPRRDMAIVGVGADPEIRAQLGGASKIELPYALELGDTDAGILELHDQGVKDGVLSRRARSIRNGRVDFLASGVAGPIAVTGATGIEVVEAADVEEQWLVPTLPDGLSTAGLCGDGSPGCTDREQPLFLDPLGSGGYVLTYLSAISSRAGHGFGYASAVRPSLAGSTPIDDHGISATLSWPSTTVPTSFAAMKIATSLGRTRRIHDVFVLCNRDAPVVTSKANEDCAAISPAYRCVWGRFPAPVCAIP